LLVDKVKERSYKENITDKERLLDIFKEEIKNILGENKNEIILDNKPSIIMMVGVNGVGKTSASAKLANMLKKEGRSVLFAAADTFRSAAVEQLSHFADMLGIELIHHQRYSDPGAVVYDSIQKAKAKDLDTIIIDTAGRIQTSYNLMGELKKINKVVEKNIGRKTDEILMVLDSNTGQNARSQVEIFNEAIELTGIVLTKIDSTAKGGIVLTIKNDYNIPVKFFTHGEDIEDIKIFDPDYYVKMLFGEGE
jgi:fused signal recognition particle receptor